MQSKVESFRDSDGLEGLGYDVRHVACSGARIRDVIGGGDYSGQSGSAGGTPFVFQKPQIEFVEPTDELITITIGGNDIGFGRIVRTCLDSDEPCGEKFELADGSDEIERNIRRLSEPGSELNLAEVYTQLADAACSAHVVVMGYPQILPEFSIATLYIGAGSPGSCPIPATNLAGVEEQFEWIREKVSQLNDAIAGAVEDARAIQKSRDRNARIHFVDVEDDFLGGELCGSSEYVNGLALPIHNSFHPTVRGYAALAGSLMAAVEVRICAPLLSDRVPGQPSACSAVRDQQISRAARELPLTKLPPGRCRKVPVNPAVVRDASCLWVIEAEFDGDDRVDRLLLSLVGSGSGKWRFARAVLGDGTVSDLKWRDAEWAEFLVSPAPIQIGDMDGDGGDEVFVLAATGATGHVRQILKVEDDEIVVVGSSDRDARPGLGSPAEVVVGNPVAYGSGYSCRDMTGDGKPEFVMLSWNGNWDDKSAWVWTETTYKWSGSDLFLHRARSGVTLGNFERDERTARYTVTDCREPHTSVKPLPPPPRSPAEAAKGVLEAWKKGDLHAMGAFIGASPQTFARQEDVAFSLSSPV